MPHVTATPGRTTTTTLPPRGADRVDLVDIPSRAYEGQRDEMKLIATVRGGTRTMRAAGKTYLPQFPQEPDKKWELRRARSTFYNAFAKTLRRLSAFPFSRKMTFSERLPEPIRRWFVNDCDLCGNRIDLFAVELFKDAVADGVSFILVDKLDAKARNLAEERALGNRPYLIKIDRRNVIGWKTAVVGGKEIILEIRIRETATEPDPHNPWDEIPVRKVRVFRPGAFALYREDPSSGRWALEDDGPLLTSNGKRLSRVPVIPFYTHRIAPLQGESPLIDLAYLNIEHWQSRSDQTDILHTARVPIPVASGFQADDFEKFISSTHTFLIAEQKEAKITFAEISGESIEAGRQDLEDLENRMRRIGFELLMKDKVVTATERKQDDSELQCEVSLFVQQEEDALTSAAELVAEWEGISIPDGEDSLVGIHRDFGISTRDPQEIQIIQTAMEKGLLTKRTGLEELQRRGVLDDNLDIDAEILELAAEDQRAMESAFKLSEAQGPPDEDEDEDEEEPEEPGSVSG